MDACTQGIADAQPWAGVCWPVGPEGAYNRKASCDPPEGTGEDNLSSFNNELMAEAAADVAVAARYKVGPLRWLCRRERMKANGQTYESPGQRPGFQRAKDIKPCRGAPFDQRVFGRPDFCRCASGRHRPKQREWHSFENRLGRPFRALSIFVR